MWNNQGFLRKETHIMSELGSIQNSTGILAFSVTYVARVLQLIMVT